MKLAISALVSPAARICSTLSDRSHHRSLRLNGVAECMSVPPWAGPSGRWDPTDTGVAAVILHHGRFGIASPA